MDKPKNGKSIVFVIDKDTMTALEKAIKKINASEKYNISKRSFCKTALNELLKNYSKVWDIKENK